MAKQYFGSGVQPLYTPNANSTYFRSQDLGLLNHVGRLAVDGDFVTHVYHARGSSASVTTGLKIQFYSSSSSDINTATLEGERDWSRSGDAAYSYAEIELAEHYPMTAGRYYWICFRGLPGSYAARAASSNFLTRKLDLGSAGASSPATLNGITWTSIGPNPSVIGVLIANLYASTVYTLSGDQVQDVSHVGRWMPDASYRQAGVQVDCSDFSSSGAPVTVRADGSFLIDGWNDHTFKVRFSLDSGSTWSDEFTITVVDATKVPARLLVGVEPTFSNL